MTATNTQSNEACCSAADCADANASCRLPVLTLFVGAAFWLVISSVFALIASIKFHKPDFMGDCPWFTYGHVHAAHLNALAYGFCAQAGIGVTLWLLAQTGKTRVAMPVGSFIAAKLWNLGVLVGIGSIMAGKGLGYEFFEFSQAGSTILFIAYLMLALAGILTFAKRMEDTASVTPWFLVAALFWFPWVYMTTSALLGCMPVRGVAQAAIAWWFAQNFLFVWLGLIGLGTIFYFVPKYAGRPLHSRQYAFFTFWLLLTFGSWSGIPASAPLPAWMPAVSAVGSLFLVGMICTLLLNVKKTSGCLSTRSEPAAKFMGVSVWAITLYVLANAVTSYAPVSEVVSFTWVTPALTQLLLYGFFGMLMIGAIYHITPELTQAGFICTRPLKIHFGFALVGTLLLVGALALAGVKQGKLLADPTVSITDVVRATLVYFRLSTLGDLLILLGGLTLLFNLGGALRAACKLCCAGSVCGDKTAEVKK